MFGYRMGGWRMGSGRSWGKNGIWEAMSLQSHGGAVTSWMQSEGRGTSSGSLGYPAAEGSYTYSLPSQNSTTEKITLIYNYIPTVLSNLWRRNKLAAEGCSFPRQGRQCLAKINKRAKTADTGCSGLRCEHLPWEERQQTLNEHKCSQVHSCQCLQVAFCSGGGSMFPALAILQTTASPIFPKSELTQSLLSNLEKQNKVKGARTPCL